VIVVQISDNLSLLWQSSTFFPYPVGQTETDNHDVLCESFESLTTPTSQFCDVCTTFRPFIQVVKDYEKEVLSKRCAHKIPPASTRF
jgi:hypothetical protein